MDGHFLLRAAARALGTRVLAEKIGIREAVLIRFMAGRRKVPDTLALKVIDLLEGRRMSSASKVTFQPSLDRLSGSSRLPIESGDGQDRATPKGGV